MKFDLQHNVIETKCVTSLVCTAIMQLCMCCIVCDRPDDERRRQKSKANHMRSSRTKDLRTRRSPDILTGRRRSCRPPHRSHRIKQHDAQTNAPTGPHRISVTNGHQRLLFVTAATRATVQRALKRVFRHIPQDFNCSRRTTCWIDLHSSMLCHR